MSEVRLWNVARSQSEVQLDMGKRLTGLETGLIGYWPLNEGISTILNDLSKGNHGNLFTAIWREVTDLCFDGNTVSYCQPQFLNGITCVASCPANTYSDISKLDYECLTECPLCSIFNHTNNYCKFVFDFKGENSIKSYTTPYSYVAGEIVVYDGRFFQCKDAPYTGWCALETYAPTTANGPNAWTELLGVNFSQVSCPKTYYNSYIVNFPYKTNEIVPSDLKDGKFYQCKEYPASAWCAQEAYKPSSVNGPNAWTEVNCSNITGLCLPEEVLDLTQSTCSANQYFDNLTTSCLNAKIIGVTLEMTKNPQIYELIFTDSSNLLNSLGSVTNINIQDYSSSQYSYVVNRKTDKIVELIFNFQSSIIGIKLLTVLFNYTQNQLYYMSEKFDKNIVSKHMQDYYLLQKNEVEEIKKTQEVSQIGNTIATSGSLAGSIAAGGGSSAAQSLLILKLFNYFKFIDIKFPPNVLSIFELKEEIKEKIFLKKKIKVHEEDQKKLPEKFIKYDVNPYFLNNFGEELIRMGLFFFCGNVFLFITGLLNDKINQKINSNNIFKNVFVLTSKNLNWNILITFYCDSFMDSWFFIWVEFYYLPNYSKEGKINWFICLLFFLINLIILIHFFFVGKILTLIRNHNNTLELLNADKKKENQRDNYSNSLEPVSPIKDNEIKNEVLLLNKKNKTKSTNKLTIKQNIRRSIRKSIRHSIKKYDANGKNLI